MNTTRTTSTPASATISEENMIASLKAYVAAHCAIEKIEAIAKERIEQAKAEAEQQAKSHKEIRDLHEGIVKSWATANPDRFSKRRKIEVYGGHKIGFDLGQPALTWIKATGSKLKQTAEGFIAACKAAKEAFARKFIRTVEEPDKAMVLRWYNEQCEDGPEARAEAVEKLATLGARVTQTERFVIDLNLQPDAVGSRSE